MSESKPESRLAARQLELEQAFERTLAAFAVEHEALLREACEISDGVTDMKGVVTTTMLGYTATQHRKLHGRGVTEQVLGVLFDHLDAIERRAAEARARETATAKERMH